jgi:hypothetical protein
MVFLQKGSDFLFFPEGFPSEWKNVSLGPHRVRGSCRVSVKRENRVSGWNIGRIKEMNGRRMENKEKLRVASYREIKRKKKRVKPMRKFNGRGFNVDIF